MLSRKEQDKLGYPLPEKWTKKVASLLTDTYEAKLAEYSKTFFVAGFTYPNELWVGFSLISTEAAEAMNLGPGVIATAVIKSTNVVVELP